MAKVGIVTVLYNSETVLKEYFESLESQTFKDFTLYLIDNKSSDRSLAYARELSEQVSFPCVFFAEPENWGIAKGNNIGIRQALADGCPYILLSNNDIILDHADTIELMVRKMDNSDIDILCPKIYYYAEPNRIWAAGGTYRKYDTGTLHYGIDEEDCGQYDKERKIRYTPTCFVLIRSSVFDKIGMMDEWYFVYYDDTDFMYRADRGGLKIYYTPETSLLHNVSSSTGIGSPFTHYSLARNHLYFVRKNRPAHIFWGIVLYRALAFSLKHCWTRPAEAWKAELKGLKEGFREAMKI